MKIYAINGSPRKNWNTAQMLSSFLDGAASAGKSIETELIQLSDLDFSGCISCLACKRLNGKSYGRCKVKDDLTLVLDKLSEADGVAFGSPIYFGNVTGVLRNFMERLMFPFNSYETDWKKLTPKRFQTAMIYTMSVTEDHMHKDHYQEGLAGLERALEDIFSKPQILYAFNTIQVKNFDDYKVEAFSGQEKTAYHETQFPIDCRKAFGAGLQMAASRMTNSNL